MSQHSSVEEEAWIINGIHRWSDAELYHGLAASHRPLSNCCVRQSQPIKLTGSERYSVTRTRSLAWIMDSPEVTPHSSLLTPHSWLLVASLSAHPLSPLSTTGRLSAVWQDFPLFLPSIQLHKEPGPVVMLSTSRNFNSFWLPHTYWDYMHSFSEQYTSYLYAITVINCFIIEIKCWRLFW